MNVFSYNESQCESTIKDMIGELKEFLEKETNDSSVQVTQEEQDEEIKTDERLYFTFLGEHEKSSVTEEVQSPLQKKYASEKLGEFFNIKEKCTSTLSSKIKNLRIKSSQALNAKLKHKISDKIFNL